MLKINIITIGKNKETWVAESIIHFRKMLRKFVDVSIIYIPDKTSRKKLSEKEVMQSEADLILPEIKSNYPVALTDKGSRMDSLEFAQWFNSLMQHESAIDFIIGGIYGLDDSIMKTCREKLSLSPMTMSHQLIRPVLLEQIYRAFSILTGGKYHK